MKSWTWQKPVKSKIKVEAQQYPFSKVLDALDDLRNGRVEGRAVITFEEFDE